MCPREIDHPLPGIGIRQPAKGYRTGIDAMILAAHVVAGNSRGNTLDIGTGVGIIPLLLAHCGFENIIGVEIQQELFDFARENAQLNDPGGNCTFMLRDFNEYKGFLAPQSFDVIVSNPPFYPVGSGRINPDSSKAIARHEIALNLDTVMRGIRFLLKPAGKAFIVYPATGMTRFFNAMVHAGLGLAGLRAIHPAGGRNAALFVAELTMSQNPETNVYPAWEIPVQGKRVPGTVIKILEECNAG